MSSKLKKTLDKLKYHTINPVIINLGKKIEKKNFSDIPIIIGACPRSGTTLLLSILAACKNIFAIPNQTAAFNKWKLITNSASGQEDYFPPRMDRLYREFLYNKIPESATRWLEKTPRHIQHFQKILKYYGEQVQLINMVRDGRDVVTSKHPKHRPGVYYLDIDRWVNDVGLGLELKNHPQVLTIRYEDIINDFESSMKKVYSFIKEDVPDSLHEWKTNTSIKKSKHWDKPVQDLYTDSILRWKKPEHKERIDKFLNDPKAMELLNSLGYK